MKYKAYLNDTKIHLYYTDGHIGRRTGAIYELGYHLMDFSAWENDEIKIVFRDIIRLYLDIPFDEYYEQEFDREKLYDLIDELDTITPYYHFYCQALLKFMEEYDQYAGDLDIAVANLIQVIPNAKSVFDTARSVDVRHYISNHYEEHEKYITILEFDVAEDDETTIKFFRERLFYFNLALDTIFDNFSEKKEKIKQELDYITNITNDRAMGDLTPIQRLYILDYFNEKEGRDPVYTNVYSQTYFSPDKIVSDKIKTKEELSNLLQSKSISIVEMVDIKSIDDLIRFEIVLITKNELPIRRCKNCNLYFIPHGRIDSEYCHRRAQGETKACNQVGAMKVYQTKFENDRIHQAYNKAYKRLHARRKNGNMSQEDFLTWLEQSKQWRDMCYNGDIDILEFERLLSNKTK